MVPFVAIFAWEGMDGFDDFKDFISGIGALQKFGLVHGDCGHGEAPFLFLTKIHAFPYMGSSNSPKLAEQGIPGVPGESGIPKPRLMARSALKKDCIVYSPKCSS